MDRANLDMDRDGFVLESTSPNADIDYRALVSLISRA